MEDPSVDFGGGGLMGRRPIPIDLSKLRSDYREGKTLRELAEEWKCSHVCVWRKLKDAGEPIRKKSDTQNHKKMVAVRVDLANAHAAHAVILYDYGVPIEEIAASLRHTAGWVREKLAEAGVKERS